MADESISDSSWEVKLPSSHSPGDPCLVKVQSNPDVYVDGYIRAVIFSEKKVRFSVWMLSLQTTFHNVDSFFIHESKTNRGKKFFGGDNYS